MSQKYFPQKVYQLFPLEGLLTLPPLLLEEEPELLLLLLEEGLVLEELDDELFEGL